jgi:hypothetical protein
MLKFIFMTKLHFFNFLMVIFLFSACKKDNESKNYLRGKIDGQAFECNAGITANKPEPIPGSGDDPTLRITGNWPAYSLKLMLIGEGTIQPGTYNFESNKQRSATLWYNNTDAYYAGNDGVFGTGQLRGSGSITITEISKNHVRGNFEFIAETLPQGTTTVTNGEFAIERD